MATRNLAELYDLAPLDWSVVAATPDVGFDRLTLQGATSLAKPGARRRDPLANLTVGD